MPQVKAEPKESLITEEMKQAAAASVAVLNEQREKDGQGDNPFTQVRRQPGQRDRGMESSDIPVPAQLDIEDFGPSAFSAVLVGKITGSAETQEFMIDEAKATKLQFQKAGQNLPKKRLYTIKAFNKVGVLIQLPFEPQVQNNAGGDPQDAIGLRRYERKGHFLLIDWQTMQPVYCAAWDCWAQADGRTGFCSERHAKHTLPNKYKDAGAIVSGLLEQGVTTSRTWSV